MKRWIAAGIVWILLVAFSRIRSAEEYAFVYLSSADCYARYDPESCSMQLLTNGTLVSLGPIEHGFAMFPPYSPDHNFVGVLISTGFIYRSELYRW